METLHYRAEGTVADIKCDKKGPHRKHLTTAFIHIAVVRVSAVAAKSTDLRVTADRVPHLSSLQAWVEIRPIADCY